MAEILLSLGLIIPLEGLLIYLAVGALAADSKGPDSGQLGA